MASPNFSFSTLSIPIFIVVVELGQLPHAPAKNQVEIIYRLLHYTTNQKNYEKKTNIMEILVSSIHSTKFITFNEWSEYLATFFSNKK